jgi:hypothetical protein
MISRVRMGNHSDIFRNLINKAVYTNSSTNFKEINTTCSSPPLEFTGMFHAGDLTCQWSQNYMLLVLINNFVNFLHIFICATCGAITWMLIMLSLQSKSPHISIQQTTQKSVLQHCHQKMFWGFHEYLMQFPQFWSKMQCKCIIPSNQPSEYHGSDSTCTVINTPRKTQGVITAKFTRLAQKIAVLQHLVAECFAICPFHS